MPKLSAFLTNYNHGQYLAQAIEGILNQSFKDLELIIVDDGSTDDSAGIIGHYKSEDPRVSAEIFPHNRGNEAAVRQATGMCGGEYLFAGAADDYLAWGKFFECALREFTRHDAGIVYGGARILRNNRIVAHMGGDGSFLDGSLFIPGASALLKRACFDALGGFNFDCGAQADFFINHAVAVKYGHRYIPCVMAHVRQSPKSLSASDGKRNENHRKVEAAMRRLFPGLGSDDAWARWRKVYGVK
jgi:glycosyltransferase involved in cell wall biosynthesis